MPDVAGTGAITVLRNFELAALGGHGELFEAAFGELDGALRRIVLLAAAGDKNGERNRGGQSRKVRDKTRADGAGEPKHGQRW